MTSHQTLAFKSFLTKQLLMTDQVLVTEIALRLLLHRKCYGDYGAIVAL
jgi:hypothetical protein